MVVNMEDLLLVCSQLRLGSLQEHNTAVRESEPWNLLVMERGSSRTFSATRTAWVLDLRPTVADPCFTASMAYSI